MRPTTALTAASILFASASAGMAADFNSAVRTVLSKQERITELPPDRRRQMIACVQTVLANVPAGQQRYVAEAANYDEMESRFGEIVLADNAKFKQQITSDCGGIAVSQD